MTNSKYDAEVSSTDRALVASREAGEAAFENKLRRDPLGDRTFVNWLPTGLEASERLACLFEWVDGWDAGWAALKYGRGLRARPPVKEDLPHPGLLDPLSAFAVMDLYRTRADVRERILDTYLVQKGKQAESLISGHRALLGIPAQGMLWYDLRRIAEKLFKGAPFREAAK